MRLSASVVKAADFQRLIDTGVIGTSNPKSLQRLVWVSLALHFGKRGAEGWRGMCKSTFVENKDAEGRVFLEYHKFEKQKNHPGGTSGPSYRPQGRVYKRPSHALCPVSAYRILLSVITLVVRPCGRG